MSTWTTWATLGTSGGYTPGGTDVAVADGGTGASTASGARTNLGLAIGTDVQAQDAELSALAGLTSAADKVPYFTGSGTAAVADFTSAGRALVDDADAAAQRTTLGLGTMAAEAKTITTQDDLLVGGAAGALARLAKGSDSQVLTVDPTTHHLIWATPSSGFSDPMTTRGDMIIRNAGNTTARLGRGSAGDVLTSDGTDIAWAAPSGGGSSTAFPLDSRTLNGTYGDHFTGAALDGKWTRHVQGSGEESYQQGVAATHIRVAYSTGAAARYIYQAAPNGTNETWETCINPMQTATSGEMFCLLMVDTSGNGVGIIPYNSGRGYYLVAIASHTYSSTLASRGTNGVTYEAGQRMWMRLRKASGVYSGTTSFNGWTYQPELTGTPSAFTPARVGVGRILGTDAADVLDIDWFDKTA